MYIFVRKTFAHADKIRIYAHKNGRLRICVRIIRISEKCMETLEYIHMYILLRPPRGAYKEISLREKIGKGEEERGGKAKIEKNILHKTREGNVPSPFRCAHL